jgi:hypothetical protein
VRVGLCNQGAGLVSCDCVQTRQDLADPGRDQRRQPPDLGGHQLEYSSAEAAAFQFRRQQGQRVVERGRNVTRSAFGREQSPAVDRVCRISLRLVDHYSRPHMAPLRQQKFTAHDSRYTEPGLAYAALVPLMKSELFASPKVLGWASLHQRVWVSDGEVE